jgi:hypothetical protein
MRTAHEVVWDEKWRGVAWRGGWVTRGRCTLESMSCFHFLTASKEELRVMSNTTKAPTAS